MEPTELQHDETIVPVRPVLRGTAHDREGTSAVATTRPRWVGVAAGGGVALAGVVATLVAFYWLPARFEEQRMEQVAAPVPAPSAAASPALPPLTPEEQAALKSQAEALLAGLLTLQDDVTELNPEAWAKSDWERFQQVSAAADNAFIAEDFRAAVSGYTTATELGGALVERGAEIITTALRDAEAALAAGDAARALEQYATVLTIEPDHAAALAGRAKAEKLPQVLTFVARGDTERERGEWDAALASYRQALALDPDFGRATDGIAAVNRALRDSEFDRRMSAGFASLAAEEFAAAAEAFKVALALRPNAAEAREGLTQAEEGAKLDQIALTEVRALAFERRELWDQAIALYRAALGSDPTLLFAQQGLERAEARAGLDAKLSHLIDNPTLLYADNVLADAKKLIESATAETTKGPRLEGQIATLTKLVESASTPLPVRLQSDELTSVTLYRVGALGSFAAKEVELRPGTYTVIGSRDGFRDVRHTFTVRPGRNLAPISVVCSEPI